MGDSVLLVVTLVLVISVYAQAQEELSKEGILCITQNREKTALGRWIHCLQTSSSTAIHEDAQDDPFQILKEPALEKFAEHNEVEQLIENKVTQNDLFGDGEEDKVVLCLDNENAKDAVQVKISRSSEEDALFSWLKLNLAVLVLCKLLFGLFKKCSWKIVDKNSSEPSMSCSTEESLEAIPEISKSVIFDDMPSKNHSATANLRMLGSSLGSAVGSVFFEVLLISCSSRSSVSSNNICMILETALKELSALVEEDDCCSRLVSDFITSFRSTYSTMYRIQQACSSYGGPGVTDSNLKEDNGSFMVKSIGEKEYTSAKSCVEVIHTQRTDPGDDASQAKERFSLHHNSANSKQEMCSVPAADASPELSKCSRPLAVPLDLDSGAPATSTIDYSVESNMNTEKHKTPSYVDIDEALEETLICASAELTDKIVTHLEYEVDDASSVCEGPPSLLESNVLERVGFPALVGHSDGSTPPEFQKVFLKFYERHVRAQEQHNQFKFVKLQHMMKQQALDEEKIQLASAANGLMRENINLGRSTANFKENRALEQQAKAAHMSFCSTCADELAAGLCVMLTALVYSVRMYSFALLNDLVSMCQPAVKEPRRSAGFHIDWFYNSLDSLAGKLQAIVCHFTVTGRILIGSILVGVVAQSLLRRSVTNSSQAMPATILIIVLGGLCGFVGKISVDSLGGSGIRWWVVWGTFCLLHALINCFTPSVYRLLHGSSTRPKSRFGLPFWIRRLAFHATLVLFLPLLAGLLPFGTFSRVMNDIFFTSVETLAGIFASFCEWVALSIQK